MPLPTDYATLASEGSMFIEVTTTGVHPETVLINSEHIVSAREVKSMPMLDNSPIVIELRLSNDKELNVGGSRDGLAKLLGAVLFKSPPA